VTTKLQALNIGIEEFVEHSYYETWDNPRFKTDPSDNPHSPYHMRNKDTRPRPSGQNWLIGLDLLKQGKDQIHTPFELPRKGTHIGAGFWGAGRGYLTHHAIIDDGVLSNYQIVTPSTWNASPKDPQGNPGPYEEAAMNTPILENAASLENFKGLDILRTIRRFDPCMPCTTHVHVNGTDHVIVREVNTCACGLDE
jgi:hydrogenase large subunit